MAYNQQDWQQPPYVSYVGQPQQPPGGYGMQGGPQFPAGYPPLGQGQGYPTAYPMQGGYPQGGPMMGQGFPGQGFNPQGGPMMGQGFPGQGFNPHVAAGFDQGGPKPGAASMRQGVESNSGVADFSDASIRRAFIRKVYSILMLQLLVTVGLIAAFLYSDGLKLWTMQHSYVMFIAMGMMIVLLIMLTCCESVRRKSPQNFICLGLFTLVEGFLLGIVSSVHGRDEVLLAGGITVVICLSLTIFSFQTKWDFTAMGGILFVAAIILLLFGILSMFFPVLKVVYACAGAFIFCCYLVYDTQLMLGGKHKNAISPEEYIFAALSLYLDIVNIFMYILAILSSTRDD